MIKDGVDLKLHHHRLQPTVASDFMTLRRWFRRNGVAQSPGLLLPWVLAIAEVLAIARGNQRIFDEQIWGVLTVAKLQNVECRRQEEKPHAHRNDTYKLGLVTPTCMHTYMFIYRCLQLGIIIALLVHTHTYICTYMYVCIYIVLTLRYQSNHVCICTNIHVHVVCMHINCMYVCMYA
jgi:hypothetical protein